MFTLEQLKILNGNTITERERLLYRLTKDELKSNGFNDVIIGIKLDETNLKNRLVPLEYAKNNVVTWWCVARVKIMLNSNYRDYRVEKL